VNSAAISSLILQQPPGHSLQRHFYHDPQIYEHELARIFLKSWLYVGHVSRIPRRGDWLLFEIDCESVIIANTGVGGIAALLNVCRHRGSRICTEATGSGNSFVCRYHGWTYDLDGGLRGAGHTGAGFDRAQYGLKRLQVRVFHGMIFINFDPDPVSFDPIEQDLDAPLTPYRLDQAKEAYRKTYAIEANWKLAVENYCECYHCAPSHPEYSVAHGRAVPPEQMKDALDAVFERAEPCGLTRHLVRNEWLKSEPVGIDRAFDRYALFHGHVTGSRDGKPVAPLLGDIRAYDGGTTDMHIGPVTFYLAYCDHVVIYRFTPRSLDTCDCELTWLVRADAEEGRDYRLEDLIWLWDVTTQADKRIIEDNAAGVCSRYYEPGPYTAMEDFARRFIEWYLAAIG
jgi:phenylpropionate dioxygenase-like ring-hydroxylating dioxygenase large terminal subunit